MINHAKARALTVWITLIIISFGWMFIQGCGCAIYLPFSKHEEKVVPVAMDGNGKVNMQMDIAGTGNVNTDTGKFTFTGSTQPGPESGAFTMTAKTRVDTNTPAQNEKEIVIDHQWDFVKSFLFFFISSFILVGFITLLLGKIVRATPYAWLNCMDKRLLSGLIMALYSLAYTWIGNLFGITYHDWVYEIVWAAIAWFETNRFWRWATGTKTYANIIEKAFDKIGLKSKKACTK